MRDTKEKKLNSEDLGEASGGMNAEEGFLNGFPFKWNDKHNAGTTRCVNCGQVTICQNLIVSKDLHIAWFCSDCAKNVSSETLENDYEYYTWQEGPNTFYGWRKKQK